MFNDERINFEMGKLKKFLLMIICVLSILMLGIKFLFNLKYPISWYLFITEGIAFVSIIACYIGSFFIKTEIKDEQYYQAQSNYYNKAFKVILYVIFITYAIQIPAYVSHLNNNESIVSSNIFLNLVLFIVLFFGYSFLHSKKIYFNYNIVEEDNKKYYICVLKNILKIVKFFSIVFGCSLCISIFYINSSDFLTIVITIVVAYFASVLSNGLYYLFISFLEKILYKEEYTKKISTATIIVLTIAFLSTILYLFFASLTSGLVNNNSNTLAKLLSKTNYFQYASLFFTMLGIVFLVNDINKIKDYMKIKKILFPLFFVILIEVFFINIYSIITYALVNFESTIDLSQAHHILNVIRILYTSIFSLFYIIICLFVIVNCKKDKKYILLTTLLIVSFLIKIIHSFIMRKESLLSFTIFSTLILICLFITIVSFYFNNDNKIN